MTINRVSRCSVPVSTAGPKAPWSRSWEPQLKTALLQPFSLAGENIKSKAAVSQLGGKLSTVGLVVTVTTVFILGTERQTGR